MGCKDCIESRLSERNSAFSKWILKHIKSNNFNTEEFLLFERIFAELDATQHLKRADYKSFSFRQYFLERTRKSNGKSSEGSIPKEKG